MPEPDNIPKRVASVMEDPSALAVARVYADAFLNAAGANVDGALEEFTSFLDDVLQTFPDFEAVLLSGFFSRDEKVRLIDAVVGKFGSQTFTSFLRVLARHERLELLPLILRDCRIQHEIRQELDRKLPFEPIVEPAVDPSLIGGIVIQVGDTVYDDTLRNRMKQLRARLRHRSVAEIQRSRTRFATEEQ